jgi:hypothetical protein
MVIRRAQENSVVNCENLIKIEKENQRSQNFEKIFVTHFIGHKSDKPCGLLKKRKENHLFVLF